MKYWTKASVFWVLVAGQSFSTTHGFSVAKSVTSKRWSQGADQVGWFPRHAATLADLDPKIALDSSADPLCSDTSVPAHQQDGDVFRDGTNFPMGGLPTRVVRAAFDVLIQWGKIESAEGAKVADQLIERFEIEDPQMRTEDHIQAAGRAENAALWMEELVKANPFVDPIRVAFSIVVRAYAEQGKVDKASAILRQMENSPNLSPTNGDYSTLLATLAKQGKGRKAEEMLKRMVDLFRIGKLDYAPGLIHYNMILDAWARSKEEGAGERARQILEALHGLADQGELTLRPDERTYTAVMNAVVRNGPKANRLEKAKELLDLAVERGIVPGVFLLTSVMQAYANLGVVEKTEEILKQMEEEGIANSAAYNTVIKAWKSSAFVDAPERAERCLEKMTALDLADTIGYTTVIASYANRGDPPSAEKAESLLQRMRELGAAGNGNVKPNVQTVNAVLNSWVQCGDVVRAEMMLNRMEQLYETGESDISPTVVSYATVCNGWGKSKLNDSSARAERVFRRMVDAYNKGNQAARPNLVSYVTLVNAIIRSGDSESAHRAEDVLFEMHEKFKAGDTDIKPNARVVALVMECWQKSGKREAGEKAEALLNWMLDIYLETRDKDLQPNEYICSLAISAWSKSRSFGKAARARGILQKMKALHHEEVIAAPPNTHCYTAVINSCAYCMNEASEKRQALEIALATYQDLQRTPSHGKPNHVTYATMIMALTNLLPPSQSRSAAIASIFKRCCETGQVDTLVIKRLQGALTKGEIIALCPDSILRLDGRVNTESIPLEWRQNVL